MDFTDDFENALRDGINPSELVDFLADAFNNVKEELIAESKDTDNEIDELDVDRVLTVLRAAEDKLNSFGF